MAYLHKRPIDFADAVNLASEKYSVLPAVVEKDYYVTMILRLLAEKLPYVVFKGGTSLSKCHQVIKRFSEDIDITIDTKISQGQMGKMKQAIIEISEELGMNIPNIGETRSRRSYNRYLLEYETVTEIQTEPVPPTVIMETSFAEVSFPTVVLPVHSYIGDMMETEAADARKEFLLEPFEMKVQGIERTLIDKVFAVCDYYMKRETRRHSRHLYDIYKLLPLVPLTPEFGNLINEVRLVRAVNAKLCPSAQPDVVISDLMMKLVEEGAYKSDYEDITSRLLEEQVPYDTAICAIKQIKDSGLFD